MKVGNNRVLALCVALLCLLCVLSVAQPLRFRHQCLERESVVKTRLQAIRKAQMAYLRTHGSYAQSLQMLVDEKLIADSMQYIPWSGGRRFMVATAIGKSGKRTVPLVECSALAKDYLRGLDARKVSAYIQESMGSGAFPGLKFGDITTPNNNAGNWE